MSAQENGSRAGRWVGRNIFLILAIAALVATALSYASTTSRGAAELDGQEQRISQLQADLASAQAEANEAQLSIKKSVTGLDTSRIEQDDAQAEALMRTATTWSDAQSYVDARAEVTRRWALAEDSQFISTFLPGEDQGAFRYDGEGTLHFAYPGANSAMTSFDSTLVSVGKADDTLWTYFATVGIEVKSANGGTIERTIAVQYTVSEDGALSDVTAYTTNSDAQTSD